MWIYEHDSLYPLSVFCLANWYSFKCCKSVSWLTTRSAHGRFSAKKKTQKQNSLQFDGRPPFSITWTCPLNSLTAKDLVWQSLKVPVVVVTPVLWMSDFLTKGQEITRSGRLSLHCSKFIWSFTYGEHKISWVSIRQEQKQTCPPFKSIIQIHLKMIQFRALT